MSDPVTITQQLKQSHTRSKAEVQRLTDLVARTRAELEEKRIRANVGIVTYSAQSESLAAEEDVHRLEIALRNAEEVEAKLGARVVELGEDGDDDDDAPNGVQSSVADASSRFRDCAAKAKAIRMRIRGEVLPL